MGLTYGQCKALGIAHLWPRGYPKGGEVISPGLPVPIESGPIEADDGMNKTERAFGRTLDRAKIDHELIRDWWFEPFKLRLAGRTWLKIDFLVDVDAGRPCVCETKGYMRDDAAVKLKVCAEKYTCFRWLLVRREGRHGWETREVTRNGLGTRPIGVPWIHC